MAMNCMASISVGCLVCCKGCNPEKIRNTFTFVPPEKSYVLKSASEDKADGEEPAPTAAATANGVAATVTASGQQPAAPRAGLLSRLREGLRKLELLPRAVIAKLKRRGGEKTVDKLPEEEKCRFVYALEGLDTVSVYKRSAQLCEAFRIRTSLGNYIPVVWIRPSEDCVAGIGRPVLIHCHGNATDLGMMMGPYYELAHVLGIDVLGVEYSGYGAATGEPSERNTYADLDAALDFVVSRGVPPERIIAYGQSVGTGPVVALASQRRLAGAVLHSPLLSGIKVIDPDHDKCCRPSCVWPCFDFYQNFRRVRSMKCPLLIMHGRRDDIIPFHHATSLQSLCPAEAKWPGYFPSIAGHNDLVEADPRRYYGELSKFLQHVVGPPKMPLAAVFAAACAGASPATAPEPATTPAPAADDASPAAAADATTAADAAAAMAAVVGREAPTLTNGDGGDKALADNDAALDFLGSSTQPLVGLDDGRYEEARRGNLHGLAAGRER
eukprot:TRINITY_DN27296_c0_g1_i1.p1 TRINITY_DN27296_c0_g1~~TRINITY_DN27296_c0_g1_i1.p1  ORF type:complete len:497 (+),score=98.98 TRINITY_DN27296_c0_g1_i1:176-1666(+)